MRPIDIWYFPSNYGDIRLESLDDKHTRVIWFKLTPQEAAAMTNLAEASNKWRRKWSTPEDWAQLGEDPFSIDSKRELSIDLNAPLKRVAKELSKVLNPKRETVHVMRIGQGKIEEIHTADFDAEAEPSNVKQLPYRREATDGAKEETALARTGTDDVVPVKAATLKQPYVGCPAPSFEQVRLRATAVLRAFLSPEQVEDFEQHQRFVTIGADTGHRYMLTSRNAPDELKNYGARCVYDIDERRPYCVHDWEVPAEEELLSLHCLLSIPGHEHWARGMPDPLFGAV